MVVGLTHSRGVIRIIPDEEVLINPLEGVSSNVQRDAYE
jgi:hypothetical protein